MYTTVFQSQQDTTKPTATVQILGISTPTWRRQYAVFYCPTTLDPTSFGNVSAHFAWEIKIDESHLQQWPENGNLLDLVESITNKTVSDSPTGDEDVLGPAPFQNVLCATLYIVKQYTDNPLLLQDPNHPCWNFFTQGNPGLEKHSSS
jgi:hypothetical protein